MDSFSAQLIQELRVKNEETEKEAGLRLYKQRNVKQQKFMQKEREENFLESKNKVNILGNVFKQSLYEESLVNTMKAKKNKKADSQNAKYIKENLYQKGIENKQKCKEEILNKVMESEVYYVEPVISQMQLNNSRIFYIKFNGKYEEVTVSLNISKTLSKDKVKELLEHLGIINFNSDKPIGNIDENQEKAG